MKERRKDWIEISRGSGVWVNQFDTKHSSAELLDVTQAETEKGADA